MKPRTSAPKRSTSDGLPCEPLLPGHLLHEAVEIVEEIHNTFLKSAAAGLSDLLQTPVTLAFHNATQAVFSEILGDAESRGHLVALDLSPLQGCGFLSFPPDLLFRVMDILLATPDMGPEIAPATPRTVTAIELYILREFFDVFAQSLQKSWAPAYPVTFAQIEPKDDGTLPDPGEGAALVLSANMELGGNVTGFRLIVPAFLARLVHMKAKEMPDLAGRPVIPPAVLHSLGNATLRVDAVMDSAGIRVRDLLDLTPGQVLMVGSAADSPFGCLVNGRRVFGGDLVASGGHTGLQIETLDSEALAGASLADR